MATATSKDCITPRSLSSSTPLSHHHRVSISIEPSVSSRLDTGYYSRPSPATFEPLKSEQARLSTFNSTDCPWPVTFISPAECAKAGFFFLKDGDKVQCAFCRGVAGEWDEGDVPLTEHKKHFPRCPFVCNLPVGNIPISQQQDGEAISRLQGEPLALALESYGFDVCGPFEALLDSSSRESYISSENQVHIRGALPLTTDTEDVATSLAIRTGSGPMRKNLVTLEARLKTFTDWPKSTGQTPEKMADAGFFYIGTSDHVKCFYCDGGLRNWEEGDNPWREHAQWFGKCPYVLLNKGQDYIKQIGSKSASLSSETPRNSSSESEDDDMSSLTSGSGIQSGSEGSQASENSESPTPSTSDIGSSDSYESDEETVSTHSIAVQLVENSRKIIECQENPAPPAPAPPPPEEPNRQNANVADIAEELRLVKEERQCKICMDDERCVVFLPCGHLVSCVRCATALSNCALCRQPIKAVVRTYLS